MPADAFDIYAVGSRYVAVTSPVRRAILRALAERPRRLPDLARLTGRGKAVLSAVHVRELLDAGLVAERPDPRDGRVKWFALRARRIGSSTVPVPELRRAVRAYAARAPGPGGTRLRLAEWLAAVGSPRGPSARDEALLHEMGTRLALLAPTRATRSPWAAVAAWLRAEGVAQARVTPAPQGARLALRGAEAAPALLAGLVEGLANAWSPATWRVRVVSAGRRSLRLSAFRVPRNL